MLQQLQKFYEKLQQQQKDVLNQDVDEIVAEKVAKLQEQIKDEVKSEIAAEAMVLDIKMEAISDAMKLVEANTTPAVCEEDTAEQPITPNTTEI